jgi:hypothetical protein
MGISTPVDFSNILCNAWRMRGRPPKLSNPLLAEELKKKAAGRGWSMRRLASEANLHVSTVTRSLNDESFSGPVMTALLRALGKVGDKNAASALLHKSLLLLDQSNKIRDEAEAALREALDYVELRE